MIAPVPNMARLSPYAVADLSLPEGRRPVLLAQNESLRPPSPLALEAAALALDGSATYPDSGWTALREAIAATHGLDARNLLCGAGSMTLIAALAAAYLGPSRRGLSPQYGYLYFRTAALMSGADVDLAPETDFKVDPEALLAAVRPETSVVFLAEPANPTGTRIGAAAVRELRACLPERVLLIVDEAYGEFADGLDAPLFDLADRGNAVLLRTFSKAYGLAGLRCGWGLFPPAIAREVGKLLNPSEVSRPAQAAACAAMADQAYMRETCQQTADQRDRTAAALRAAGIALPESHTNFLLLPFANADEARRADESLRARGLLLRGMGAYGLPHALRATVGTGQDMDTLVEILTTFHAGGRA